jgi:hypothetical protein
MWRTDLGATEPYWRGWFTGLSSKFLGCKTAKLLLLAGADRLDKELMVAQMQGKQPSRAQVSRRECVAERSLVDTGKYQLEIFPEFGHCVQEVSLISARVSVELSKALTLASFALRRMHPSAPLRPCCSSGSATTGPGTSSRASRRSARSERCLPRFDRHSPALCCTTRSPHEPASLYSSFAHHST